MDEKPGCIHPGDPQGWCGTDLIAFLMAAVLVIYAILRKVR